ncbi:CopG family transcriptional regulator [Jeotgalibacillus marinus]|uniref:CopG family transcriptional regulator n=1 Tax=Jeotgalibacillus marinus TaxID=86667 RepID=A0ABV3Q544_9BACL
MADTEKITVNMNVVDLGKIDLLVEQGFYSNRTDLIKSAIRNQLTSHAGIVDEIVVNKAILLGVLKYSKKDLEKLLKANEKMDIKLLGMLILEDDIDEELAIKTIESIKILGVFKAKSQLKKILKSKIK